MAKKSKAGPGVPFLHPTKEVMDTGAILVPITDVRPADLEPVYIFERRPACPRCGARDGAAYATKGPKQYRACRRGICRYRFVQIGRLA